MVFFTALVAPIVFKVLPMAEAGKLVSVVFPRYYLLGYICGAIGFILAVYLSATRIPRMWWATAALALLIALGLTVYAGAAVRPQADAIRSVTTEVNPDPARRAEFDRLHHLSVMLNGAVMLLNLAALFSSAVALTPRG
jgi:sulfite exporter TauE/SafE